MTEAIAEVRHASWIQSEIVIAPVTISGATSASIAAATTVLATAGQSCESAEVGLPAVADDERELRANIAQSVLIGRVHERLNQDLVSGPVNARNQIANLRHLLTSSGDHMRLVAEIIIRSNPDIVNMVEVENLAALSAFNDKFLAGRGYRAYLTTGTDTFTGQDVGMLTRIDPDTIPLKYDDRKGHSGTVQKSVSKNYVARMNIGELKLTFIGLHFLAFPISESRKLQRQAQADAIRSIAIEERAAGFLPVVLGDFNDYDGNPTSLDHINSSPISTVLSSIRAMAPDTTTDDLVNAASFVPQANRFTAFFDANQNEQVDPPSEFTSIDHILLSPELAPKVELVEMPHQHDPRFVADHFPVVVRLKLQVTPPPPPEVKVVITSLVPNPLGNDNLNEEATLKNLGTQQVNLSGWKLRDLAGKTWSLNGLGTLAPNQQKIIKRNNQPMALNNGGDTIDLVNPSGMVVQTVTYGPVVEGEAISP